MASIEDIWGEDTSIDPLFHDDAPAESPARSPNRPTTSSLGIGAAAAFDEDFDFDFTAKRVDQVAILREANARNSRQVLAASMSNDRSKRADTRTDPETEKGKKPRVIPKLDQDRLLGKDGLPALIREARGFKLSEKGREMQDLSRLLYMYQLWGHKMFPKMPFREMVERVERLCHRQNVMRAYQAYQKAEEEIKTNGGDEDGGVQVNVFPDSREASPASEKQVEESEAPNVAESELDTNVDAELDAMFEDMSRSQAAPHEAASNDREYEVEMDIEALIEEHEQAQSAVPNVPNVQEGEEGDDEDMWDLVHEIEAQEKEKVGRPLSSARPPVEDSDDDLYAND